MEPCWDAEADIVVAGAGGAGLMAALAAADEGARIVVLEAADRVGGKSAIAIGSFTASETAMQRAAGIEDSHDAHLEDMARLAKTIAIDLDLDRARLRIEEDTETFARLVEMGVAFSGPHPEAPHRMPRMHNMLPSPASMVDILHRRATDAGATVRTRSPIVDVLLDKAGRVAGAVADGPDGPRRIAAGAVVLAAGDSLSNPVLVRRFSPRAALSTPIVAHNTGAPFLIAMRIGARIEVTDLITLPQVRTVSWPHVEPSPGLFELGAALIDRTGRRHSPGPPEPGTEVPADEELFVVIDAGTASRLADASDDSGPARDGWQRTGKPFIGTAPAIAYAYLDDCRRWVWFFEAPSLAAAARQIRCGEGALAAALGGDAVPPLSVLGPFKRHLMGSNGSLVTDTAMRVLDEDDAPIPGLYAAGDTTRWFEYAGGHGYGLSWATTSGRLAGRAAAEYVRRPHR